MEIDLIENIKHYVTFTSDEKFVTVFLYSVFFKWKFIHLRRIFSGGRLISSSTSWLSPTNSTNWGVFFKSRSASNCIWKENALHFYKIHTCSYFYNAFNCVLVICKLTFIIWDMTPSTRCLWKKKENITLKMKENSGCFRRILYEPKEWSDILTLPSMKSCVPMLTTVHPIALPELRHKVWFSFLSHGLRTVLVLIALSSIVPGTATLISLLKFIKKKSVLS